MTYRNCEFIFRAIRIQWYYTMGYRLCQPPNRRKSGKEWEEKTEPAGLLPAGPLSIRFLFHSGETLAAIDRAILPGLEGHMSLFPAGSAHSRKHLTLGTAWIFAGLAAFPAALGLVSKAFFRIEFLFPGCEHELPAALCAGKGLVLIHDLKPRFTVILVARNGVAPFSLIPGHI